jgi:ribosome recycling factor
MRYSLSDIENKKKEIEDAEHTLHNSSNDPNFISLNSKQMNAYNNNLLKIVNKKIKELRKIEKCIYKDTLSEVKKQPKKELIINGDKEKWKYIIRDNKVYYINYFGCMGVRYYNKETNEALISL